jgi:DNA-binding NtrC family response regulator
MRAAVLYVDDEVQNLDAFRRSFDEEVEVLTAQSGPEALALLERASVGLVFADQKMEPMTGIELLAEVERRWPAVSRVLLTAYSDRELLLAAIRRGRVHDYVLKPWDHDDLSLRIRHALEVYERHRELSTAAGERDLLRDELRHERGFEDIIGWNGGLRAIADALPRIAPTDATVMLRGESGTGKEIVARELHRCSKRAAGPFVRVNCAAFAEGVLESELFGHEPGAFTGAAKTRIGRFEQAHGGTLFLDEIGDISAGLQVRLLRVLQERELERVGGNRTVRVDIRVIAATHRALETLVREAKFREDLFHRLNVVPLWLPPLRERVADIPVLAAHFVARFSGELGKQLQISDEAVALLARYDWPGNVRELRNVIERACVLADPRDVLGADDLSFDFAAPQRSPSPAGSGDSVYAELDRREAEALRDALLRANGSKAKAAKLLGIPRTTLNDRLRRHGIS